MPLLRTMFDTFSSQTQVRIINLSKDVFGDIQESIFRKIVENEFEKQSRDKRIIELFFRNEEEKNTK